MKFALMGKVLCDSCKIERRSNVIQRLFKRSCIIAKAFLSPPKKTYCKSFRGNICIYFKEIFHNQLRGWNELPIFPSNILVSSLQISLLHGSRLWNSSVEVQQKGLIPCLRRKKKEWMMNPSFFRFSAFEFLCHLLKASIFFRVTRV